LELVTLRSYCLSSKAVAAVFTIECFYSIHLPFWAVSLSIEFDGTTWQLNFWTSHANIRKRRERVGAT